MLSTRLAFAAAVALVAVPAAAQDVQYELINSTGLTLMEFYTAPAGQGTRGDDLLGANVVAAGEAGTVTIAGGEATCDYDLIFVFEDGQEVMDTANICETPSYTLSE
jgi:hypothetical protein